MSAIGMKGQTLAQYAESVDPSTGINRMFDTVRGASEVFEEAMFFPGDSKKPGQFDANVRTGLPASYWKSTMTHAAPMTKSTTVPATFPLVRFGLRSTAPLSDDPYIEERPVVEDLAGRLETGIFYGYGDSTMTRRFSGLSQFYNKLDRSIAESYGNVIDAGGEGNNLTSAWLIVWGDLTLSLAYRSGHLGLERVYQGKRRVIDDDRGFDANVSDYDWIVGLMLRDWRYVVRVANIDVEELTKSVVSNVSYKTSSLIRDMIRAHNFIPNIRLGRAAWYMNSDVKSVFDYVAGEMCNVNLTVGTDRNGNPVTRFKGIPIRRANSLRNTEFCM